MKRILLTLILTLSCAVAHAQVVGQGKPASTSDANAWPVKSVYGGAQVDPRDIRPLTSGDVITTVQGTPGVSPWLTTPVNTNASLGPMQNAATANSNGSTVQPGNPGYATIVIDVSCVSCDGATLTFQGNQTGTQWYSLYGYQMGTVSTIASAMTTVSGHTYWKFDVAGVVNVRTVISGYVAGSITTTAYGVYQTSAPPAENVNVIGTVPVSAASLPLPSGAATSAKQPALGTAGTPSSDVLTVQGATSMTPLKVDGSAVTQPVSASSLPLPSGASTSANQTTGNTSLSSIDGKLPALSSGRVPVDASVSAINALNTATGTFTFQNSVTANGNGLSWDVAGTTSILVYVQCTPGCSGGTTINFEASPDNTTFYMTNGELMGGTSIVTSVTPNDSAARFYKVSTAPGRYIRFRISAYSAGTVFVFGWYTAGATFTNTINVANSSANPVRVDPTGTTTQPVSLASVPSHAITNLPSTVTTGAGAADASTPRVAADLRDQNGVALASPDANGYAINAAAATATTAAGASRCTLVSAATTNATNCKNAAGNVYGFRLTNTTTTVYYLRLYNLTTAPTCSSATGFVESIPIPPAIAAGGVGGFVAIEPMGEAYSTGIGFCLTGGSSSTDNTSAATGLLLTILYK